MKLEVLKLSLLTTLSPFIVPLFTYIGYFYNSFTNIVYGEQHPPEWNITSHTINGFIPILYSITAVLLNVVAFIPLLFIDNPIGFIIPAITVPITVYLYPASLLWFEFDVDFIDIATTKQYVFGFIQSLLLFIGVTIAVIILSAGLYFIAAVGGIATASSVAIFDNLALLALAIIVGLVGLGIGFVYLGCVGIAYHLTLIPLGEKMNEEIFYGRTISYSTGGTQTVGGKNLNPDPDTPPHIIK